jgi:hypothetical protein
MPAKSKKQQQFMAMVAHGKIPAPKGLSKKEARKYAKTKHKGLPEQVSEGSIKSLIGGMTFSSFLITEAAEDVDTSTVRGYIRSLPQWQEMMQDRSVKPEALKLAQRLMQDYGDRPLDQAAQNQIFDEIDNLSSQHYKGAMLGDWKGEEEYQRKRRLEKDIEDVAAEIAPKQRRVSGARTGMDYEAAKKAQRARAEMSKFADVPPEEKAERLATAKTRVAGMTAPRTGTKSSAARAIFDEMFGEARPSEIINRMMSEVGMSKPHATTYYYKFKKTAA